MVGQKQKRIKTTGSASPDLVQDNHESIAKNDSPIKLNDSGSKNAKGKLKQEQSCEGHVASQVFLTSDGKMRFLCLVSEVYLKIRLKLCICFCE